MLGRLIDILAATTVLLCLSPALLVIALLIFLDSPGNPLYLGWRSGRDGRLFRMFKFRTMVAGADRRGPPITGCNDRRVTRLGGFLRKTKLDELPQFVNVLLGDMTLVGPRPEVPRIVEKYTATQKQVLSVKPGITGPVQLFYNENTIPEDVAAESYYLEHLLGPKLDVDLQYICTRTVRSDLRIVLKTAYLVIRGFAKIRNGQTEVLNASDRVSAP